MSEEKETKLLSAPGDPKRNPNDYAELVGDFAKSSADVIDSLDEKPPRDVKYASMYLAARYGVVCETTSDGKVTTTMVLKDDDGDEDEEKTKGRKLKHSFTIGGRVEAVTGNLGRKIRAASLKQRVMPKYFMTRNRMNELVLNVLPDAQNEGDAIKKKQDRENWKVYPIFLEDGKKADVPIPEMEFDPDVSLMTELTSIAYNKVTKDLGAKAAEVKVVFSKFVDMTVVADSNGTEVTTLIPRAGIIIGAKTTSGSEAFGAIRGSTGTLLEILSRNVPETVSEDVLKKYPKILSKKPADIVRRLARQVANEAIQLDRAEGSGILGSECYVILSSQASGVFVHEMLGHPAEGDIICDNIDSKTAKIRLIGTMGAVVSGHKMFNVFETPLPHFDVGKRKILCSWGAMPGFDEQGVESKVVPLITAGKKVGALTSHWTLEKLASNIDPELAKKMREMGLSGRSRSETFDKIPQVRMTTTVITPNDTGEGNPKDKENPNGRIAKSIHELASMIPTNLKGVYVKTIGGGWVNTEDGTFMLNGGLCFLIENGMVTDKPIKDVKIQGNITMFQDKIIAIGSSETAKYPFTGFCGKASQWVPVEAIGPSVLLQKMTIGGGKVDPWQRIVEKYDDEHKKVLLGQKTADKIMIPEISDVIKEYSDASQSLAKVCLVTAFMPFADEIAYVLGERVDTSTHMFKDDESAEPISRSDRYV